MDETNLNKITMLVMVTSIVLVVFIVGLLGWAFIEVVQWLTSK